MERLDRRERAVRDGVEVREVDHRTDPREPRRDLEDVLRASDLADAAHDLDAERDVAALRFEPGPQVGELLDDLGQRLLAGAAEQEAGVEDDRLGSGDLAIPAEWSSIPTAIACFLSRSTWPMNPAIGACTESAIRRRRASFPNSSAHG